jgi:hypothetical protein
VDGRVNESFNAAIRRAAGYAGGPDPAVPPIGEIGIGRVGQIGVGRGGACAPPRPTGQGELVNERIRAAAQIARVASVRGGVDLGLDDLSPFV